MKWYVLNYDFNAKKIVNYNIFNSSKLSDGVEKILKEYDGHFNKFVQELESLLKYCFWCKREYEISAGDLWEKDFNAYQRIDVYDQLISNIDILAEYILSHSKVN